MIQDASPREIHGHIRTLFLHRENTAPLIKPYVTMNTINVMYDVANVHINNELNPHTSKKTIFTLTAPR